MNDRLNDLPSEAWDSLQQLLARFESAWQGGQRPRIDDYLPRAGDLRSAALAELVHIELECRLKAGEPARVEEYLRRFPTLSEDRGTLLDLIAAEYELRRRREPELTDEEYRQRFPASWEELPTRRPTSSAVGDSLPRTLATAARSLQTGVDKDGNSPTLPPLPWVPPLAQQRPASRCPEVPGYEILDELGRGGMGVVYKARHLQLDRVVALKMILSGGHASAAELARFEDEARAIARLQHRNIVQIFEVGEQDGLPYFALEYCPGGSLDQKLAGTPLPSQEATALVETLARAMQAAHEKGVVHRDLKPANVLLAVDGTAKVTDFGLAKKLDEASRTATGAVMGTPSYMAPEQAGGPRGQIGPGTDIYALGAILYECLTGRPPFKAATALDTLAQVVRDEPVSPSQLQSQTPKDLETITLKCLQKEPIKRYASAADLAEDLRRFRADEPIKARPAGWWERGVKWVRRRPAVAGIIALVFITLLGIAFGAHWYIGQLKAFNNDLEAAALRERQKAEEARNARLQMEEAQKQVKVIARRYFKFIRHHPEYSKLPDQELRRAFIETEPDFPPATIESALTSIDPALSAAGGCHPGCFPVGTLVRTPTGTRPIESLRAGDEVMAVLPGGASYSARVQTVFTTRNRLLKVETDDGHLFTTETQPLCLVDGSIRAAGQLRAGDLIFRWKEGERRTVRVHAVTTTDRLETVFNLILSDGEVFVAGDFLARSKPPAVTSDPVPALEHAH